MSLSATDMVNNFINDELKSFLNKQKDYERILTMFDVMAAPINMASMVFSGIHLEYLPFVAPGCSASSVIFSEL